MLQHLIHKHAIALGHTIDRFTALTYFSHLQSYFTFCKIHVFPVALTPDTLSFYTIFMSHHIKPSSVDSYLSGICHKLQSVWPDICAVCCDLLMVRTLAGCKCLYNTPVRRKALLIVDHLQRAIAHFSPTSHDNQLFISLLVSGFFALHRLREFVSPNNAALRNWQKVVVCFFAFSPRTPMTTCSLATKLIVSTLGRKFLFPTLYLTLPNFTLVRSLLPT